MLQDRVVALLEVFKLERKNIEWKPIEECNCLYEVSNYGDIKRLERDFIDKANRHFHYDEKIYWVENQKRGGGSDNKSYHMMNIFGKTYYSHRLAAKAFIPNPENKKEVNHIDGNKENNYCGCKENGYKDSNLEWVTRQENITHASINGLINKTSEKRKQQCRINRTKVNYENIYTPVVQLSLAKEFINEYKSIAEASRITGVGHRGIQSVANHKKYRKTSGGYIWMYKKEYEELQQTG